MSNPPIINDSDENLASALQKGSMEALGMLYDKYSPVLFGVLKKITSNDDLAEEALQECFIHIWRNKHLFNLSKESLFARMLNIAKREGSKACEKEPGIIPNQKHKLYVNDINHDQWENREVILELIIIGGFSQKEAAEKIGLSVNEFRKMMRKEINQLRGVTAE